MSNEYEWMDNINDAMLPPFDYDRDKMIAVVKAIQADERKRVLERLKNELLVFRDGYGPNLEGADDPVGTMLLKIHQLASEHVCEYCGGRGLLTQHDQGESWDETCRFCAAEQEDEG